MAGMETLKLSTWIDAPMERCFLLSLSIDLQVASARSTRDEASTGSSDGPIGDAEAMTLQGRHFRARWGHTSLIETLRPHSYYRDVMIAGAFRHFEHDHHFARMDDGTRMRDEIRYSTRWGTLGRLATKMFLRKRLKAMLIDRNAVIRRVAESQDWRRYLESSVERRPVASVKGEAAGRRVGNNSPRNTPQGIAMPRPSV
jgi:ligand-binding SRPBCC domain-containing protein